MLFPWLGFISALCLSVAVAFRVGREGKGWGWVGGVDEIVMVDGMMRARTSIGDTQNMFHSR